MIMHIPPASPQKNKQHCSIDVEAAEASWCTAQVGEMSNGWVRVLMEMIPPSTFHYTKYFKRHKLSFKNYFDYGGFTGTIAFENKQLSFVFMA